MAVVGSIANAISMLDDKLEQLERVERQLVRRLEKPAHMFKSLIEAKDWTGLAEFIGVARVWAFDRPLTADEGVELLVTLFDRAVDIQLDTGVVRKAEHNGDSGHLSYTCMLMWGEEPDWTEHSFEFDLHIGLRQTRASDKGGCDAVAQAEFAEALWRPSYIGITQATPEYTPFPDEDEDDADKQKSGVAEGGEPQQQESPKQLAKGRLVVEAGEDGALSLSVTAESVKSSRELVEVWMPVCLPEHTVNKLV